MKYLLLLLLLVPRLAFGAVAVDADSSGTCNSGACSTVSWNHTVGGSATLLLCSVSVQGGNTSGVTWNTSNNLSPTASVDSTGGFLTLWALSNPTAGTHPVVATVTGSPEAAAGGCTSFTGAGTVGTPVTEVYPANAIIDGVSVTVPANGMAFGAGFSTFGNNDCTINLSPGTGNTERYDTCASYASFSNAYAFAVSRTTTGTIVWTNRPSGSYEAVVGVPINPAVAPPGGTTPRRVVVIQ